MMHTLPNIHQFEACCETTRQSASKLRAAVSLSVSTWSCRVMPLCAKQNDWTSQHAKSNRPKEWYHFEKKNERSAGTRWRQRTRSFRRKVLSVMQTHKNLTSIMSNHPPRLQHHEHSICFSETAVVSKRLIENNHRRGLTTFFFQTLRDSKLTA